jgi:hypothetical protein
MGQMLSREDDEYQDDQDQQYQDQEQKQEQKQEHHYVPKRRQRNAAGAIRSRRTKPSAQGRTRRKAFE